MGLNGCLTARKDIDIPICLVFFYILHYICLDGIYFSQEYMAWILMLKLFHVSCPFVLSVTKKDLNTLKNI